MKKLIKYLLLIIIIGGGGIKAVAQNNTNNKDSVVQLYGVVMTADSLRGLPSVSVIVENKGRGTMTNEQGVFSIAVLKGDKIRFSSVGFKDQEINIPKNLEGTDYSVIQLLVTDTAYLPAYVLKPRPSRSQFERDFVSTNIPADQYEIARQNTDEAKRRVLVATLPADGREAVALQQRQAAARYYYNGQQAPINLLNPFAWAEFIKAWKRGDFKRK
ncbi:MAG: carboxypeptidase-like regulatory protein [Chitinophagaceae bacterium]|nr:carboxypeptidase-like regulatory protein [Chitinophagaceae bacterium]